MKKRLVIILLVLCITTAVVVIAEDKRSAVKADNTQGAAGAIKNAGYEYTGSIRRDPFASLIVKPETKHQKGLMSVESYGVSDFKLIAILWGNSKYYAVITLPDGKSYTIREGVNIGLHGGKVYKITKDSVIIREQIRDYRGVLNPKDTALKLRMDEEG